MKNLDVADINRKVAQIIEEVDQGKAELERVRLASTVTLQSIALPLLFAHQSFPKFSRQKYYIFSPDQSKLHAVHLHTLHGKLYKTLLLFQDQLSLPLHLVCFFAQDNLLTPFFEFYRFQATKMSLLQCNRLDCVLRCL